MHNFNSVWSQTKRKSFLDWQGRSFYKLNFFVMLLWKLQKIKPTPFSLQNSAVLDVFYRYWIFEYRYSKNYKKKKWDCYYGSNCLHLDLGVSTISL